MKNCPGFEELMAFADGELPEPESSAVRAHLTGCGECRRVLETQGMLEETYRNSFEAPSEESFRLMERRIMASNPVRARRFRIPAAIPIAAALLIAVAGIRLVSGGRERFLPPPSVETIVVTADYGTGEEIQSVDSLSASLPEGPGAAYEAASPDELLLSEDEEVSSDASTSVPTIDATVASSVAQNPPSDMEAGRLRTAEQSQLAVGSVESVESVGQAVRGAGTLDMDDSNLPGTIRDSVTPAWATAPASGGSGYSTGCATASDEGGAAGQGGLMDRSASEYSAETDSQESTQVDRCLGVCGMISTGALEPVPEMILVVFGSGGEPCSPDSAFLDESFPGWKDSLDGDMADSAIVVTLEEFSDLLAAPDTEE